MGASRAAGAHGGFIRRHDSSRAGRLTEDAGLTVDGASALIIFNGITTSLCITSCVSPWERKFWPLLHDRALQGFDGHQNLIFLDLDDRVRVHLDGRLHDAADRYGRPAFAQAPSRAVTDVGITSCLHLCHFDRASRVLWDQGGYLGLRFDYHPGPYIVASRDLTCAQRSSCFDVQPLIHPCASSARLLHSNIDVVHHTPALAPCAMGDLYLFHSLVYRRRREGQAQLSSSDPPARYLRRYASVRDSPSPFDYLAPARRGESTYGHQSRCRQATTIARAVVESLVGTSRPRSAG